MVSSFPRSPAAQIFIEAKTSLMGISTRFSAQHDVDPRSRAQAQVRSDLQICLLGSSANVGADHGDGPGLVPWQSDQPYATRLDDTGVSRHPFVHDQPRKARGYRLRSRVNRARRRHSFEAKSASRWYLMTITRSHRTYTGPAPRWRAIRSRGMRHGFPCVTRNAGCFRLQARVRDDRT
jgi:hypothetical protein